MICPFGWNVTPHDLAACDTSCSFDISAVCPHLLHVYTGPITVPITGPVTGGGGAGAGAGSSAASEVLVSGREADLREQLQQTRQLEPANSGSAAPLSPETPSDGADGGRGERHVSDSLWCSHSARSEEARREEARVGMQLLDDPDFVRELNAQFQRDASLFVNLIIPPGQAYVPPSLKCADPSFSWSDAA